MNSITDIFSDITPFLDGIFHELEMDGIDVSDYELDHICYRVETMDEYARMKDVLAPISHLLIESTIGGRLIATYRLDTPILYREREIYVIELPSPKVGSYYPSGWEHAEFAVGTDWGKIEEIYPYIHWDKRGINKAINPELSLKYPDGLSIKFHEHPLEYIIETYER